jgi:hypothetical protein
MVEVLLGKIGWGNWCGERWPKCRGIPYCGREGGGMVDGGGVENCGVASSRIGDRTEEGSGGGVEKWWL